MIEIKNLTLNVKAVNNALKGNDSLTIESGNITAISTKGDSLKTTNTDISAKGNQRGDITILGGVLNLYAACDCIDAAYNVIIQNDPVINCYTDSFSDYSEEVSSTSSKILYLKIVLFQKYWIKWKDIGETVEEDMLKGNNFLN